MFIRMKKELPATKPNFYFNTVQHSPCFLIAFSFSLMQLDKSVLMGWSLGDPKYENSTLLLRQCPLTIPIPPPLEASEQILANNTLNQDNLDTPTMETFTQLNSTNGMLRAKSFISSTSSTVGPPVAGDGNLFDLGNGMLNTSNTDFYYMGNESDFLAAAAAGDFSAITTVYVTCK